MLALNAFQMLKDTTENYGAQRSPSPVFPTQTERSVLILIAQMSSNIEILMHFHSSSDSATTLSCWQFTGILGQNAALGTLAYKAGAWYSPSKMS